MTTEHKAPVYWQTQFTMKSLTRGFHLVTDDILACPSHMPAIQTGMLNLFLLHTSASLTISENTCGAVREDLESFLNRTVPDTPALYQHTLEGEDDMPAHIKNVLLGTSLSLPLNDSQPVLGQWQGIFLCEHRNQAPNRTMVITAHGMPPAD